MKVASYFNMVLKKMRSYPLSLEWIALSQAHKKKQFTCVPVQNLL